MTAVPVCPDKMYNMSMQAPDFLLGVWNSVEDAYMMNPKKYSGSRVSNGLL